MRRISIFVIAVLFGCGGRVASAHHGKDFLLVESYDLPEPGEFYLVGAAAIGHEDGATSFELEPSILVGVLPRFAFELHSHITKEPHEDLRYEATAPSVHFALTPPESEFPIQIGWSAEYEIATESSHDRFETRLILEKEIERWKLVANLIGAHMQSGDGEVGYGLGARYDFTHEFGGGLEAQGSFTDSVDGHELVVGVYFEPNKSVTFKFGIGPSINSDAVGFVGRFGVVCRF